MSIVYNEFINHSKHVLILVLALIIKLHLIFFAKKSYLSVDTK